MEEDNNNNNINNNDDSDNSNNKNESKNGVEEIYVSDSKVENFTGFQEKRSLAERRGFNSNAARINTALFRIGTTPSPSPVARSSPNLTIPPNISPTEFLDSPMMLPNSSFGLPSPTTGTFLTLPALIDEGSMMASEQMNADPNPLPPYSASQNQVSSDCNMVETGHGESQILVEDQQPLDFSFPEGFSRWCGARNMGFDFYNDMKMVNEEIANPFSVEMPMSHSEEVSDDSILPENDIHGEIIGRQFVLEGEQNENIGQQLVLEGEQKETSHETAVTRTSEDGYNWRKYGQKQVKGSEYPRSYYKCTQPNCLVKKKVERSLDGQITEIIYNGSHNHEIPHPNRRSPALCIGEMSAIAEAGEEFNADSVWGNIQSGLRDTRNGMEWKAYGQERTSSALVMTESLDHISMKKGTSLCRFESVETPERSSALANNDSEKDRAALAIIPHENVAAVNESEPKRRKKESYPVEMNVPPPRSVREPKVVVQIETEVDILDDGYRWRKYGQKVVKGNPNPRSYYKCTSVGCNVRKHVERASHDLKYVLTTYEGKHNHEIPAPKSSSHITSSDVARGANISKSETLFDRKPDFSNEFLRSSLIGNFGHGMKFGSSSSSSRSQLKYSSLNNTMPYGSYGLNRDSFAIPQAGSLATMLPDFPMPLPLSLPSSSGNFCLGGTSFNNMKPMDPVQSYLSGQQMMKELDLGFLLRPKQEQNDDDILYSSCMPPLDHASASSLTPPPSEPSTNHQLPMQNFTPPSEPPTDNQPAMQDFPQ